MKLVKEVQPSHCSPAPTSTPITPMLFAVLFLIATVTATALLSLRSWIVDEHTYRERCEDGRVEARSVTSRALHTDTNSQVDGSIDTTAEALKLNSATSTTPATNALRVTASGTFTAVGTLIHQACYGAVSSSASLYGKLTFTVSGGQCAAYEMGVYAPAKGEPTRFTLVNGGEIPLALGRPNNPKNPGGLLRYDIMLQTHKKAKLRWTGDYWQVSVSDSAPQGIYDTSR